MKSSILILTMRAFTCFAHSPHRPCSGFRSAHIFESHIPIDGTWLGSALFLVKFSAHAETEKKSELTTAHCAALYEKVRTKLDKWA